MCKKESQLEEGSYSITDCETELLKNAYDALTNKYNELVRILESITSKVMIQCDMCYSVDFADTKLAEMKADRLAGVYTEENAVLPEGWKHTEFGVFCPKCPAIHLMQSSSW